MRTAISAAVLMAAIMASGCGSGVKKRDWTAAPQNADAATCEAHGGKITVLREGLYPICVTPYPDGGKPCAGSSECVGQCIYYSTADYASPPKRKKKKGVCQKANYFPECYRKVENDVVEPGSRCQA